MKLIIAVTAAVLISASVAGADQGRRLAGPICVNKHTGVVRAIAAKKECKKNELRRYGLQTIVVGSSVKTTIPFLVTKGDKGDAGEAGNIGLQGAQGERGVQGPTGAQGPTGQKGDKGDVGPAGAQGSQGSVGPQGPPGKDGTDGLGNGTAVLCVNLNGGSVKFANNKNECDPGHEFAVTVVIVN